MFLNLFILVTGGFVVAIFSTLTGGGASLLLMPIIGLAVGTKSIAPIMTIGISLSSTSRVFYFWEYIDWRLFLWLFPATILGSVLGAYSFSLIATEYLQIIIGAFLVLTVFQIGKNKSKTIDNHQTEENDSHNIRQVDNEIPTNSFKIWYFAPIGFCVSFLSGLIGGVGPLMNSAYLKYGIQKEGLIATRSANAVLLHLTKIISYTGLGFVDMEIAKYGIILGLASILGNYWGKKLLLRISDAIFRYIVVASMIVSGIYILGKNWETILLLIQKF